MSIAQRIPDTRFIFVLVFRSNPGCAVRVNLLINCRARTSHPIRFSAWAPQADNLCFRPPGRRSPLLSLQISTFPETWVVRSCEKTRDRAGCLAGRRAPRSAVRESGESLRVRHSNSEAPGPRVYPAKQATQHCREGPGSGEHTHERRARARPSATIDSPCLSSFRNILDGTDAEDGEKRASLSVRLLALNPLPPPAIATLVDLGKQKLCPCFGHFTPTQSQGPRLPGAPAPEVASKLHHRPTPMSHLPGAGHLMLTLNNLKLMDNSMGQNPLSLSDASNSEVNDLQMGIGDRIGVALQYACRS